MTTFTNTQLASVANNASNLVGANVSTRIQDAIDEAFRREWITSDAQEVAKDWETQGWSVDKVWETTIDVSRYVEGERRTWQVRLPYPTDKCPKGLIKGIFTHAAAYSRNHGTTEMIDFIL